MVDINSLWPSDAIWWHISGSILVRVMACCLRAPKIYLKQYLLLVSEVLWHSHENNFTRHDPVTILYNEFENHTFEIIAPYRRGPISWPTSSDNDNKDHRCLTWYNGLRWQNISQSIISHFMWILWQLNIHGIWYPNQSLIKILTNHWHLFSCNWITETNSTLRWNNMMGGWGHCVTTSSICSN